MAVLSANPVADRQHLAQGLAWYDAGDYAGAASEFTIAATTTDDPGLAAFQKGLAFARLDRFREAEWEFERALDDSLISATRRAAALYNLGLTRLQREDAYRGSIVAFASCRDITPDAVLKADAEHNLEIAKTRWLAARVKRSDPPPNTEHASDTKPKAGDNVPGPNDAPAEATKSTPKPTNALANAGTRQATATTVAGAGTLPTLRDDSTLTPMNADDTRAHLDRTAERLSRLRRSLDLERAGPERRGLRDW